MSSKEVFVADNLSCCLICRKWDVTDPGDYGVRGAEGQQLSSIIKALETQTQELKSALAGMKDVVHGSDTISHLRSDSPS